MKLGEVIVTYNCDNANMQTITVITLLKRNICSTKSIDKTGHISNKPNKGEEEEVG